MDYKISGDPKEVEKVIKENRIRAARGVIKFTPLATPENAPIDSKDEQPIDSKDVTEDSKTAKKSKNSK